MPDNKVIDKEIEHPIEYKVSPPASSVTEQLSRHPSFKRTIEEIDDLCYYLRKLFHFGRKLLLFVGSLIVSAVRAISIFLYLYCRLLEVR